MPVSVFEPASVRETLKSIQPPKSRNTFAAEWDTNVERRIASWKKSYENKKQTYSLGQLSWSAAVVEYVTFVYNLTRTHGNSKGLETRKTLSINIPLYGPRFYPPTFQHQQARSTKPITRPDVAYLKPMHIIHPLFYSGLAQCPNCNSTGKAVRWDSWTTTGPRELLGVDENEYALGYQLRCDHCKKENLGKANTRRRRDKSSESKTDSNKDENEDDTHCVATTSYVFWSKWEFWKLPDGIPVFFHRTGLTRELFNLLTEFRLTMTSGGIAENIKQLHLQRYHTRHRAYLNLLMGQIGTGIFNAEADLVMFSKPDDPNGYNDRAITVDMVTDTLLEFNRRSREGESSDYTRTLSGICVGFDWTFKSALKATIVEKSTKKRRQILKGGILVANNEKGEIVGFRFCQSALHGELVEFLQGVQRRCDKLQVPHPELFAVDDCCKLRNPIGLVFPQAAVVLDVWHFQERYLSTVSQGTRNPYRSAVAHDIVNAILIERADGHGGVAKYRSKDEQEVRLQQTFEKWDFQGGVWTEASIKVHIDQLAHVKRSCLARTRQDIPTDGSRMESGNKGWGMLMNGNPCGVEVFNALSHDHVLRRNIRVSFKSDMPSEFVQTTYGSHHVRLVSSNNVLWNSLVAAEEKKAMLNSRLYNQKDLAELRSTIRPLLPLIASDEKFGLIISGTVLKQFDSSLTLENCDILEIKDDPDSNEAVTDMVDKRELGSSLGRLSGSHSSPSTRAGPIRSDSAVVDLTVDWDNGSPSHGSDIIDLTADAVATAKLRTGDNMSVVVEATQDSTSDVVQATAVHVDLTTGSKSRKRKFDVIELIPDSPAVTLETPRVPAVELEDTVTVSTASHNSKRVRTMLAVASSEPVSSLSKDKIPVAGPVDEQAPAGEAGIAILHHPDSVSSPRLQGVLDTYFGAVQSPTASLHTSFLTTPAAPVPRTAASTVPVPAYLTKPLPSHLTTSASNMTPSERFFLLSTNVNSRSYEITTRAEFILFMDMRAELQWTTERMDARLYSAAVKLYNARLEIICRTEGVPFVGKHARALMEKLAWAEGAVYKKVSSGDYKSKSGRTEFWTKHCAAVDLQGLRPRSALRNDTNEYKVHVGGEGISSGGQGANVDGGLVDVDSEGRMVVESGTKKGKGKASKAETTGKTKQDRCHRCKRLKYPGGVNSAYNHKKFFCADGVRLPPKRGSTANVPNWPQPQGVYSEGGFFHPLEFLRTIREIWRTLDDTEMYGRELNIEHDAFVSFFNSHKLILHEDNPEQRLVLFRIEGLLERYTLSPHVPDLLVNHEGVKYLRVDSLSGSQQNASSIHEESTVDPNS